MAMQQLATDLPVMFVIFVVVALGYALARRLEKSAPSKTLKLVKKVDEEAEELCGAIEETSVNDVSATEVATASKPRSEARKRNKKHSKAQTVTPPEVSIEPPCIVEEVSSPLVAPVESDISPTSILDNMSGVDAEASTDTSPCWAKVEKIKAKKAMRKAKKMEALNFEPLASANNDNIESLDCDVAVDCNDTKAQNSATTLARVVPEPLPAVETTVEYRSWTVESAPEESSDPVGDNSLEVEDQVPNEPPQVDESYAPAESAVPEIGATNGTIWGDVEDSVEDPSDREQKELELELMQVSEQGQVDAVHFEANGNEEAYQAIVNQYDFVACNEQASFVVCNEPAYLPAVEQVHMPAPWNDDDNKGKTWNSNWDDDNKGKTWKSSKWSSNWDEDPVEQSDDWMKPFDDLIAVQASQFQTDVLPCNDGWNQGFDMMPPAEQQFDAGFDMMCCNGQQLDPSMMLDPNMQALPNDGQQQLYTDGEMVYMMMCVEVPPDASVDQNGARIEESVEQSANMESSVTSTSVGDGKVEEVDADLLTDDEFEIQDRNVAAGLA